MIVTAKIVTFRLTSVTFCDGEITVKVDASARATAKEEVATSEEVTSVHAVKPSSRQAVKPSPVAVLRGRHRQP